MRTRIPALFLAVMTAVVLVGSPPCAVAGIIWDTGPATGGYPYGWILDGTPGFEQYAAGRLPLTGPVVLTSIEGWISGAILPGGDISVAIYSPKSVYEDVPGALLFRTDSFDVAAGAPAGWYGIGGLSIPLGAGQYFISFEPTTHDAVAQMPQYDWYPGGYPGFTNPMPSYAFYWGAEATWKTVGGMYGSRVGMRISGTQGAEQVSDPGSTLLLLGIGLVGLGARRKRRN